MNIFLSNMSRLYGFHIPCYGPFNVNISLLFCTCSSTDVSSKPHRSLEETMKDLKTGDIVVSAGVGVGGAFMRITDVSIFSHASIVVRDPYIDQPCLWESIGNDEGLYHSS